MEPTQPQVNIRNITDNPAPQPFPTQQEMEASLPPVQQQVVQQTNAPKEYTLSNGTKISFKKPGGVVSLTIAKILGADSMNPAMNIYYRMLFCLDSLNGTPIRPPKSSLEIEALVQRLGDEETFAEALAKFHEWADLDVGEETAKK
jgi:hypothetical protein